MLCFFFLPRNTDFVCWKGLKKLRFYVVGWPDATTSWPPQLFATFISKKKKKSVNIQLGPRDRCPNSCVHANARDIVSSVFRWWNTAASERWGDDNGSMWRWVCAVCHLRSGPIKNTHTWVMHCSYSTTRCNVCTYKSIISKMLEMFSMTNISVREASVSVRVTRQACEKKKEKILNFLLLYQEIFSQSRYL